VAEVKKQNSFSGRAKTVLVFGRGKDCKAIISSVVVQARSHKCKERICFVGPATFDAKTAKHIKEVVLPAADKIISFLGLPKHCFDISVSNLGAASLNDIGLKISGYSADVPILLAILSASMQLTVPETYVSTGHISSPDGDIRMVSGIPAKLSEVEKVETIQIFVYPDVEQDTSLDYFTPAEKEKIINAILKAKSVIRTVAVRNINDLVRAVFPEEKVIFTGLKKGFFKSSISSFSTESAVGRAVAFFIKDNEKRFWNVLERQMIEGRSEDAKQLLLAFARFYIGQEIYPEQMGIQLFNLIQSLPPETRRKKIDFPLLPLPNCIQLSQLAHETELEDVLVLFKAATWDKTQLLPMADVKKKRPENIPIEYGNDQLQSILSEIDADALTASVSRLIDNARAVYVMGSVVVESNEDFNDSIASYYSHLLRHTRQLSDPIDLKAAGAEGFALLERAFSKRGGLQGALAEARNGTNGGLRFIFDMMTEQFKQEQQEKRVNLVLNSELDPLDWDGKVAVITALLSRLKNHLPSEILSQPAERYAGQLDILVKAYVQSIDQVKALIRSI
jgi:hypothetical protein